VGCEDRAREKYIPSNMPVAALIAPITFTLQDVTLAAEPNTHSLPPILAAHHAHDRSQQCAELVRDIDRDERSESSSETVVGSTAADILAALDHASSRPALLISVASRLGQPGTEADDECAREPGQGDERKAGRTYSGDMAGSISVRYGLVVLAANRRPEAEACPKLAMTSQGTAPYADRMDPNPRQCNTGVPGNQ